MNIKYGNPNYAFFYLKRNNLHEEDKRTIFSLYSINYSTFFSGV